MIAPAAMVSRIRVPPPPPLMAKAISPTPIAATPTPIHGTYGASLPGGSRSPRAAPRSAARGSPSRPVRRTRPAPPRGRRPRGRSTLQTNGTVIAAVGRSTPEGLEQRVQPDGEQDAERDADQRRHERPISGASISTERSTWRREAPSVRSIPNSRTRWATVIEKVLKMMNAPTKTATQAKTSRRSCRKLRSARDFFWSAASAFSCRSRPARRAASPRCDAPLRAPSATTPLRGGDRDLVDVLPDACRTSAGRRGRSSPTMRGAADRARRRRA